MSTRLARRHQLYVLAYQRPDQVDARLSGLDLELLPFTSPGKTRGAAGALAGALQRRPRSLRALCGPLASRAGRLLAEQPFDVVHVVSPVLAGLAPALDGRPAILASLDAWHLNARARAEGAPRLLRPLELAEERNIRRFGRAGYRQYDRVVTVSDADARAMRTLDPSLRLAVIPNGVDVEAFSPSTEPREEGLIVFTGAFQWAPNEQAACFLIDEVLPQLRQRRTDATVALVGRNPSAALIRKAEAAGVLVTGEVRDVRPWLWRATVFACPMVSGTGIKNKLLEALACGTPCVATTLSLQGIRASPERDLLVADGGEEFAAALDRILGDEQLRRRLSSAGREAVASGHSWDEVAEAYERLYEDVTTERSGAVGAAARQSQP